MERRRGTHPYEGLYIATLTWSKLLPPENPHQREFSSLCSHGLKVFDTMSNVERCLYGFHIELVPFWRHKYGR